MPLRKRIQIATIAFFCLVISAYLDVEALERLGLHLINVHPHPKFYGNVLGNLTPNRAATVGWGTKQTYRYTTDGQGLRSIGQGSPEASERTVLCLGDSYTFGLNVADAEGCVVA